MIAKLLVISLLAVEQMFAEEATSVFQTISLPGTPSSLNRTTPEASKESNISSNFIIINSIPATNVLPFRLQRQKPHSGDQSSSLPKSEKLQPQIRVELKDLAYYPVERDTSRKNESVDLHQQIDRPRGKSKGYIEFEFDIDDEISTSVSSNTTNSTNEEVVPYSSALNRIWSSLIPRSMTDIFKLSYSAGPHSSKDKTIMLRSKPTNSLENRSRSSVKRQSVDNRDPKLSPTVSISSTTLDATEEANTNISALVTRKDIHDINVAAEVINTSKNLLDEAGRSPIETPSLLGEQIGRNESDFEDYSLNLGEDNFIAPSQEVSKQLVYPSPLEMQTILGHDEKHGKSAFPALERQINVQIIQDNLGGYGQKLPFSPSKQLDDIHDEVEKQFNTNDITRQSEAASRKFLKKFKTNFIIRPASVDPGYQIVIKPKTIQPESLLHTYIYSSESLKDPVSNEYSTGNNSHASAAPESANQISERIQAQTRSEQARPAGFLHTYIFSSESGKDSYNKSNSTPTRDKADNVYEWNARPSSENQGTGEISPLRNNLFDVRGLTNEAEAHMYTTAPYHSAWPAINSVYDGYSTESNTYVATPARNAYDSNEEAQPRTANPKGRLHTYIFATELNRDEETNRYNKSDSTLIEDEIDYNYEGDAQTSENQETRKISLQHSNGPNSRPDNYVNVHSGAWHDPVTQVEIQKSVNIHNKYITEKNGNLIEQHEIYTRPKVGMNFNRQQQFKELESNTQTLLSEHPIRVAQAEELQQSESAVESESIQHQNYPDLLPPQPEKFEKQVPGQAQIYRAQQEAEAVGPVSHPASRENIAPQQYQVGVVEKYIDRPVHVEHIFEKQVNVPYPVREVVEKIVDRPVPVEKIIDRPVHIPYAVQVDHFIDRPYAVQVPVAVPFPVHRYIDRPYPVEKIVDRPIHIRVPYPVETVVEKIVEKHVPVEVERIVEKPVEKIVEKQVARPYAIKEIVNQPVPIPIPVPVGVPVAVSNTKSTKRKPEAHYTGSNLNDFLELVPPSLPAVDGQGYGYKTLPENIDILLLDDSNFQIPNRWGQPVKRGTQSHYIKRSPEFGRHFRVEYGFKPPIVPSLEIDDKGLPLAS